GYFLEPAMTPSFTRDEVSGLTGAIQFVGRDGQRITRGTLQSRIKRAFKLAGPDAQPVPGAMVHGLRHTFATELASADVSVYTLMKLLGHESMVTSQRYVTAAGTETRTAAAQNHLYELIADVAATISAP
ncbi:tyrosine-type recombinase/integrase, partial [Mycolicibacterium fortuitum]|uniref:tyrosine-type recombinase/integrase n=1 Tax=Mycolicibacterium fortuitum TaxID=1766 RepID=UPI00149005DE|nr:phage integrase family protein [Mycolicibacterium fortuitum]